MDEVGLHGTGIKSDVQGSEAAFQSLGISIIIFFLPYFNLIVTGQL